jgi:hypothetical protein
MKSTSLKLADHAPPIIQLVISISILPPTCPRCTPMLHLQVYDNDSAKKRPRPYSRDSSEVMIEVDGGLDVLSFYVLAII